MPCAAGALCALTPDHTPGPPQFTNHKCRVCSLYLHPTCGMPDPLGDSETHRVCEPCVNSTIRKASGTPGAELPVSKRHCEVGGGKGKGKAVEATRTSTSSGLEGSGAAADPVRRKARGADTRVRLSYEKKADALVLLETMTGTAVAAKLGVGVSSVYKWRREADRIKEKLECTKPGAKSAKGADFPEVEASVLMLVRQAKTLMLPTQRATVQAFGRKAFASLVSQAPTDAEREQYAGFTASKGWANKFIARNHLRPRTPHGEAAGEDDAAIADRIEDVRETCKKHNPECIYNVDSAALFYRVLPKTTYLAPGEDRKTTRGVRGMQAKDRVTAYVATNATGTRKVPLSLVGTAKSPRCFKLRDSPVRYFCQANAWSDVRVFREWWLWLFLPYVRSVTTSKVLLLVGSHSGQADLVDPNGQVTILELPLNCTSKHQPMDAGIIAAWKARYRTRLLTVRVDTMASAPQLREQAERRNVVQGCMGLAEGGQPHLLDVAEMGLAAWADVSQGTIARCWRKANILPGVAQADLDRDFSEATAKHNERLHELAVLVQRLSLAAVGQTPDDDICDALFGLGLAPGTYPSQASIDAAEAWIGVEENKHVALAVVEDLKYDLCLELFAPMAGDCDDDDSNLAGVEGEASEGGKDRSAQPGAGLPRPPPYADVADGFGKLEEVAERYHMLTVSYYLRKAKLAWMTEVGSRE